MDESDKKQSDLMTCIQNAIADYTAHTPMNNLEIAGALECVKHDIFKA